MIKQLTYLAFPLLLALAACDGESRDDVAADGGSTVDENSSALRGEMPCEVAPLIEKYCGTCHGATPTGGAPVSLATADSFQNKSSNGTYLHARSLEKMNDKALPMPPVSRPQPTEAERSIIARWLQGGAQKSRDQACAPVADAGEPVTALPALIPDSECEVILELRTHDGERAAADAPAYTVDASQEHYECFYFPVPFLEKMHILKIEPLVDNAKVLHHYLLYQETEKSEADGSHKRCTGTHPTASLLTGWAPGGFATSLPPDVGLQVGTGANYQFNLEVHYNNSTPEAQPDRSGVRICATSKLRKNEAAAHWLGTELILVPPGRPTDAVSTCVPKETAHIISVSPHMHRIGRHMKTEITRANGATEILTDRPFDFADQQIYPVGGAAGEVIVGPGDSLKTTCTFENDTNRLVTYGSLTSQEMCYNFVVAWPVGSLDTGGGLVQGPNRCM